MAGLQPNSQRPDEANEQPLVGPFGGVQSEAPISRIEDMGFSDVANVLFRKGAMQVRPQLYDTTTLNGPIVGAADFFDVAGLRHQVVMTPTSLWRWDPGTQAWVQVTGTMTGGPNELFSWSVVANKLLFCQGVDKVQVWDGIAGSFGPVSANAVPANYLFELDTHLLALNTIEAGPTAAHQRVHWTGAGDPTDWTSFSSGQTDLFNDLGPITGGVKLYQSGFIMQYWGITQAIPTGIGLAPFEFIPLSSRAKGNVVPHSLSNFGEEIACYIGKDNVYQFDGNQSIPIGDRPLDGSRYRSGARKRILADLQFCLFDQVSGFITTSINGQDYFAYWLFMPQLNAAWVYHFDEGSWTRETFAHSPLIAGNFFRQHIPRIMDLVGPISAQLWSPASLTAGSPFDDLLIGFDDDVPRYIDFTGVSEQAWFVQAGNQHFRDFKHKKTVTAVRLVIDDLAQNTTATLVLTSNKGDVRTLGIGPVGTGTGNSITIVLPVQPVISGTWITWKLSGNAGAMLNLTEITPLYDIGGAVRAGGVD